MLFVMRGFEEHGSLFISINRIDSVCCCELLVNNTENS